MFEDILNHRKRVAENIAKSFGVDIEKAEDIDIEKAHQVGDIHPNGKWVWTQLPSGKFDWRTIGGRAHKRSQASAETKKTPEKKEGVFRETSDEELRNMWKKNVSEMSDKELSRMANMSESLRGHKTSDIDKKMFSFLKEEWSNRQKESSAKRFNRSVIIDNIKDVKKKIEDLGNKKPKTREKLEKELAEQREKLKELESQVQFTVSESDLENVKQQFDIALNGVDLSKVDKNDVKQTLYNIALDALKKNYENAEDEAALSGNRDFNDLNVQRKNTINMIISTYLSNQSFRGKKPEKKKPSLEKEDLSNVKFEVPSKYAKEYDSAIGKFFNLPKSKKLSITARQLYDGLNRNYFTFAEQMEGKQEILEKLKNAKGYNVEITTTDKDQVYRIEFYKQERFKADKKSFWNKGKIL